MNILEINQKKVLETAALLSEIIKDPLPFIGDETLKTALKSQGYLAKYFNEKRGIASCSLNTLKSASELLLNRGFVELDEMRISAKNTLERALDGKNTTAKTKAGLKHKMNELQAQLSIIQKSNFLQSCIIEELRGELKQMAYSNQSPEQAQRIYHEFNKRIEAKLSYTLNGEL